MALDIGQVIGALTAGSSVNATATGTISWTWSDNINVLKLTTSGSVTISNPTSLAAGKIGRLIVILGAATHTVTLSSAYKAGGGQTVFGGGAAGEVLVFELTSDGTNVYVSQTAPLVSTVAAASPGSTLTLTMAGEQTKYARQTLTANLTITLAGAAIGRQLVIPFRQAASGGPFTITWPGSGINWRGGTAPVMPTTAGAIMLITLYYDGTSYLGTSTTF